MVAKQPQLSILVPTVSLRAALLSRLLATLEPQLVPGRVEVLVHDDDRLPMGAKFNALYAMARGRLAVLVDDDDLVVPHYVQRVLAADDASGNTCDFIGYRVRYTVDGFDDAAYEYIIDPVRKRVMHATTDLTQVASMLQELSPRAILRSLSQKCPVLTARAQRCHFGPEYTADAVWIANMLRDGYPHRPVFIDEALYRYDHWPAHSLGAGPETWTTQRATAPVPYDRERFTWVHKMS